MNGITDALKTFDESIWMSAALRQAPSGVPIVFDSMRFECDYNYLRTRGFTVWRVVAARELRWKRMAARGQEFSENDEKHPAEWLLESKDADVVLQNEYVGMPPLLAEVDRLLLR